MASAYDTYGSLKCKEVLMDVSGITLHDPNNDTKKLVLNASGLGDGTATLSLPTATGALLSDQSTLPGANLGAGSVADAALASGITATKVDLAGAAACTDPQDTDNFWIDDAGVNKKITGANLKTFINAGQTSLPSSTDGQVLVSNGADNYESVTMSGDCTVAAGGAVSIGTNKITTAMLQNDSVDANKLANNAVDSGAIAANAVIAGKYGAGSIVNADVNNAAAIAGSKVDPDFGNQTVETTGDVQTAVSKAFRFGTDSNGSWRIVVEAGGGSLRFEKKESGAWNLKGSFSA